MPGELKYRVAIDRERCKGCELCVAVCPRNVLGMSEPMNASGCHYAETRRLEDCIGCLRCALICPDAAVEVAEEREAPAAPVGAP